MWWNPDVKEMRDPATAIWESHTPNMAFYKAVLNTFPLNPHGASKKTALIKQQNLLWCHFFQDKSKDIGK